MKSKLAIALMMCVMLVGLSVTASAQGPYGRRVIQRPNGRTVIRGPYGRRSVVILPNGRRIIRSSRSRQDYQVNRARTYRLPNGRIVTVLPNGRRIYQ